MIAGFAKVTKFESMQGFSSVSVYVAEASYTYEIPISPVTVTV